MSEPAPSQAMPAHQRWWLGSAVALAIVAAALTVGELLGWPFLASPLQSLLSKRLERTVSFAAPAASSPSALPSPSTSPAPAFSVRFMGGVQLRVAQLEVAAPAWSRAPHLMLAQELTLDLRYIDLWRAMRGQRLRLESLKARELDAHLERLADGRTSWSFKRIANTAAAQALPQVGQLRVSQGIVHLRDEPMKLDVQVQLSLADVKRTTATLRALATGQYREFPLKVELLARGRLPWEAHEGDELPEREPDNVRAALTVKAEVGRATLAFDGDAVDVATLRGLSGRFSLRGPSLAAVGDPVGVTLPTTAPFRTKGQVVKQGKVWRVVIDDATVGASQLRGAFSYDQTGAVPLLAGRLGGKRLHLVDLGPVVGVVPASGPANNAANNAANAGAKGQVKPRARVLPTRPFDLAALRIMDANVLIDIDEVDLNTSRLEPLRPLRAHLVLAGGVLTLNELDARTADGRVYGQVRLDGRADTAAWHADLKLNDVRLERWIHQKRASASFPFVSGRLDGAAVVQGQGRSTAEILSSLTGNVHAELRGGAVSHMALELAGLDVAQALGLLVKGDDALPVPCAVADLVAANGLLRPRLVVLDTRDSVVWIDGTVSLAHEALDLRAVVAPKDFSPLTLRTPLRVRGSFAQPVVSLQTQALGQKLGAAFLLGLINPLAALIPLIDPGDTEAARSGAAACQSLRQRGVVKAAVTPGGSGKLARPAAAPKPTSLRSPAH